MKKRYIFLLVAGGAAFFLLKDNVSKYAFTNQPGENPLVAAIPLNQPPRDKLALAEPVEVKEDDALFEDFGSIHLKAINGDLQAQKTLSEIYEDCSVRSINKANFDNFMDLIRSSNKSSPNAKSYIDMVSKNLESLCSQLDSDTPIPNDAWRIWMEAAARQGDLGAAIAVAAKSPEELPKDKIKDLLVNVEHTADPYALMDFALIAGRYNLRVDGYVDGNDSAFGSPAATMAWMLSACRAGAECGYNSRILRNTCLATWKCGYASLNDYINSNFSLEDQKSILNIYRLIQSKISSN